MDIMQKIWENDILVNLRDVALKGGKKLSIELEYKKEETDKMIQELKYFSDKAKDIGINCEWSEIEKNSDLVTVIIVFFVKDDELKLPLLSWNDEAIRLFRKADWLMNITNSRDITLIYRIKSEGKEQRDAIHILSYLSKLAVHNNVIFRFETSSTAFNEFIQISLYFKRREV